MKVLVSLGKDKLVPYDGNQAIIQLWLHGRGLATQDAYRRDIERFLAFVEDKPLPSVTLADLQGFVNSLGALDPPLKPASQKRILSAIKSLLSFACKILPDIFKVNAGAALKLPKWENRLTERILPEAAVMTMLALESDRRNHAILRLLYYSGIRRAEIVGLKWRNLLARPEKQTGQISVYGKGSKTRTVVLDPETWQELAALYKGQEAEDTVFNLERSQIHNIVRAAAERLSIRKKVSPHWLRHAHISHALNRGAPIHLVQQTVGHADLRITSQYAHILPDQSSANYLPK